MSALARVRTAWHVPRYGNVPTQIRDAIADEIDTDNAIVDQMVFAYRLGRNVADAYPTLATGGAR